jgi:hypothetical protein
MNSAISGLSGPPKSHEVAEITVLDGRPAGELGRCPQAAHSSLVGWLLNTRGLFSVAERVSVVPRCDLIIEMRMGAVMERT